MPPTELDLDRLEELAAKATSGPWEVQDPPLGYLRIIANVDCEIVGDPPRYKPSYDHIADLIDIDGDQANANLIVALRNALPAILAKLREGERAEELNAASHDMMMKANARLTAERDALARALAAIVDTNPANPYSWRTWLGEHTEALKIARRVAG